MKQLTPDPWHTVAEKYPVGSRVQGKVISLMDTALSSNWKAVSKDWSIFRKCLGPARSPTVKNPPGWPAGRGRRAQRRSRTPQDLTRAQAGDGQSLGSGEGKYPIGSIIKGPVRNVTDFGIFVGIEEGIDGLGAYLRICQLDKKVKHPSELFKKGDIIEAKVLGNKRRKRAFLSRIQAAGARFRRLSRAPCFDDISLF